MAKHKLGGRPNKPTPPDLESARHISDSASRMFTSISRGTAMEQPGPAGAGHSYNPQDPYQYAKGHGRRMEPRPPLK